MAFFGRCLALVVVLLLCVWKTEAESPYALAVTWKSGITLPTNGVRADSPAQPGGRLWGTMAATTSGKFYVYGGFAKLSTGTVLPLGDYWMYNFGVWYYINGVANELEYPSPLARDQLGIPGPRLGAIMCVLNSHVYLFGGIKPNAASPQAISGEPLNDMWKTVTFGVPQWLWVKGGPLDTTVMTGVNYPDARAYAAHFTDSGNYALWVWSGYPDAPKSDPIYQELWHFFEPSLAWTLVWRSNDANTAVYPPQIRQPSPLARPEVLQDSGFWVVGTAYGYYNVWVFGGRTSAHISELWMLNVSTSDLTINEWSFWNSTTQATEYPEGACISCSPGYRHSMTTWTEAGKLYFSGGISVDTFGNEIVKHDTWAFTYLTGSPNWEYIDGDTDYITKPTDYIPPTSDCSFSDCFMFGTPNETNVNFSDEIWRKIPGSAVFETLMPSSASGSPQLTTTPSPASLWGSVAAASGDGDYYLAFGQLNSGLLTNEMWRKNSTGQWEYIAGESGAYTDTTKPVPQSVPITWSNSTHLFVYGGQFKFDTYGDLWVYSFGSKFWEKLLSAPINATGSYETSLRPGARSRAAGWYDGSNYFWMYGGLGYGNQSNVIGVLSDLWRYSVNSNTWEFVSGSKIINQVASASAPGGLSYAMATGYGSRFYMYGGNAGGAGFVADLWMFYSGEWSLLSTGTYTEYPPQLGSTSPTATPGQRYGAALFYFENSVFIFGGSASTSVSTTKDANDLWAYKDGGWYWLYGSNDLTSPRSVPATTASSTVPNSPAGRSLFAWTFSRNTLSFYSGKGSPAGQTRYSMSDFWTIDIGAIIATKTNATFEWKSGIAAPTPPNYYNTTALPGVRQGAAFAGVSDSLIWMYGGDNPTSTSYFTSNKLVYSDLWQYNPTTNVWTWIYGYLNAAARYPDNKRDQVILWPGPRTKAVLWASGTSVWLFGGQNEHYQPRNDAWEFNTLTQQWTWATGSNVPNSGISDSSPAALIQFSYFTTTNLWMYGGLFPNLTLCGDLWEFDTSTTTWKLHFRAPTVLPSYTGQMHPGARTRSGLWYIPSTQTVRLYGGADEFALVSYNDFWEFDVSVKEWTHISGDQNQVAAEYPAVPQGTCSTTCIPGSRSMPSATWTKGADIYMYGGRLGDALHNDVWHYSQASGTWLWGGGDKGSVDPGTASDGPDVRAYPSFYLSSELDTLYMFGGVNAIANGVTLGDVVKMSFDPAFAFTQTNVTTTPIALYPAKKSSSIAPVTPGSSYGTQFHLFDGELFFTSSSSVDPNTGGSRLENGQWHYDIPTSTWRFDQFAVNNEFNSTSYGLTWLYGNYIYSFGGANKDYKMTSFMTRAMVGSNNFEFLGGGVDTVNKFTPPQFPGARYYATSWVAGAYTYVFSGIIVPGYPTDELWRYDNTVDEWEFIPKSGAWPPAQAGANSATNGTHTWLYGLEVSTRIEPSMWLYSINDNTWTRLATPTNPIANYPSQPGFGGQLYTPGVAQFASVAVINNRFFLFGGQTATSSFSSDLWEYDTDSQIWYFVAGPGAPISAQPLDYNSTSFIPARNQALTQGTDAGMWIYAGRGDSKASQLYVSDPLSDLWFIRINVDGIIPPTLTTAAATTTTAGEAATTTTTTATTGAAAATTTTTADAATTTTTAATTSTSTTTTTTATTTTTTTTATTKASTTGTPSVCGNGIVEPGEACDSSLPCCNNATCRFVSAGVLCRNTTVGVCDAVDYCSGSSDICKDLPQPPSFVCYKSNTECTKSMVCGNSTTTCPNPLVLVPDVCGVCGGDNTTCNTTFPGVCGDGACKAIAGETCKTCVLDCGTCPPVPCMANCNGRGTCDNGKCVCNKDWAGPTCDTENTPIVTTPNGTNVTIGVGGEVIFSLSLQRIVELTPTNQVNVSYPLNTQNITGTTTIDGGVHKWTYTIALNNSAYLMLHFIMSGNSTVPIKFGNRSLTLQPYSIKLSLEVVNWPFKTIRNKLRIDMAVLPLVSDSCASSNTTKDDSGNVRWAEFTVNQKTLYGSFLDYALMDEVFQPMQVNTENDGSVLAFTIPHFWVHAVIDPDFSVIVGHRNNGRVDECGNELKDNSVSNKTAIVAGVTVAAVALAALAIGSILFWKKKQTRFKNKLHRLSSSPSTNTL